VDETLKNLLEQLEKGGVLNWLEVMEALNAVTNLVTLNERPAAGPKILTVCELNGRCCCGD